MKIVRSEADERKLLELTKKGLARRPRSEDKLHVSELMYPRKTYWQKIDPQPMTDDQALYFTAGRAHHEILEFVIGSRKKRNGRADAGEHERDGVYFSPDLRMSFGPIEIKTSRSMYEPKNLAKGYDGYLKQLKMYMALMDSQKGGLLVFYLVLNVFKGGRQRKMPALRFYRVTMTPQELKKERAAIKKNAAALNAAIKKKKWAQLDLCPEWLCRDCVFFKRCKPWLQDAKRKSLQKEAA